MSKTETIANRYILGRYEQTKALVPFDIESGVDLAMLSELARYSKANIHPMDEDVKHLKHRLEISDDDVIDYYEYLLQSSNADLMLDRTRFVQ